jgi:hypothetical protein
MAALTAASFTVTIKEVKLMGRKRYVRGTLAFGNGTDTYPTGGIPLPSFTSFGFYRQMDSLDLGGVNGLTTDFRPTPTADVSKLQLWVCHDTAGVTALPMDEAPNTAAPAARTYSFEAWGW